MTPTTRDTREPGEGDLPAEELDVDRLARAIDACVPYNVSGGKTYKRRLTGADAQRIAAEYALRGGPDATD